MKRNVLDLALLGAILVGGALAWSSGRERSRLSEEYARLAAATGDLTIGDPGRAHLLALETGEPLHFAWRAYFPANYPASMTAGGANQSMSMWSSEAEFILRIRFRESDEGRLEVYTQGATGSTRFGVGDRALADVLRGRWGEIRVERLGAGGVAILRPDEPATLLRVALPEAMQEEARRKLPPRALKQCVPSLYELTLGASKP